VKDSPAALSGITILDLSRVLAGPFATMLLGDMGARVIKIETPGHGDDTRHWGPPFAAGGLSAYFISVNRNKESVTLNLKSEQGRAILTQLALRSHVLMENFRAGTMDGWGIGYGALQRIHPSLVYCAITGFGQTGPYRDRPGYDNVIEAMGGLMSVTGPPDLPDAPGTPCKVGVAVADIAAGLYAAISILAALRHAERTGCGQYIDISLFDSQLSWLANVASSYLVSGAQPARYGNEHASIVPYQTVTTQDGWIMLAVGNDGQFARLCRVLDHPEWAEDERFATNSARVVNRATLNEVLDQEFASRASQHWTETLLAEGIPCGPVNDIPAALKDAQAVARGMVQSVSHPTLGDLPQLGPAPKLSVTSPAIRSAPPLLGEHTEAVLTELLGYDRSQFDDFAANGII